MKKKFCLISVVFLTLLMLSFGLYKIIKDSSPLSTKYEQSTTPTLFFHGYGSSARAEKYMTEAIKKAGVTKTIILAKVSDKGKVTYSGKIPKNAINPLIKVEFKDNKNPNRVSFYTKSLMASLKEIYGIKKVNMVGHSMGNLAIWNTINESLIAHQDLQVQKVVSIANHVNGIIGFNAPQDSGIDKISGEPNQASATFTALLPLRENLPKDQLDVLNIYGDYKNATDGRVSNNSSKALKYLVQSRTKSYQEVKVKGALAQHSQLHENPEVDQALISFLWGK